MTDNRYKLTTKSLDLVNYPNSPDHRHRESADISITNLVVQRLQFIRIGYIVRVVFGERRFPGQQGMSVWSSLRFPELDIVYDPGRNSCCRRGGVDTNKLDARLQRFFLDLIYTHESQCENNNTVQI